MIAIVVPYLICAECRSKLYENHAGMVYCGMPKCPNYGTLYILPMTKITLTKAE